jgi:hypothetical protein
MSTNPSKFFFSFNISRTFYFNHAQVIIGKIKILIMMILTDASIVYRTIISTYAFSILYKPFKMNEPHSINEKSRRNILFSFWK